MKKILTSSFYQMFCVWKALVTNWWTMCLFGATLFAWGYLHPMWSRWTCLRLSEATQNMYEMGTKKLVKECSIISVHLVDQTGVQCYPGRGTATHAATRYSLTSWLTIPRGWWHGVAAQLREPCTQTGARVATADIEPGFRTVLL